MIASTQNTPVTHTGNMTGDEVGFSLHKESLTMIQSMLINMYSDPERAALREISCNARDATIAAGLTRPIEVITPTQMTPFFSIQDFGCGLSVQDIHEIYSQIGASTKRDTNDQTGCLGIGSKSPLAYSPQFTVSSIKDGTRVEAMVSLDNAGAGKIVIVDTCSTDEPNGTTVVVPAKTHNSIASKARTLFSFWPEGSVLLDGEPVGGVEGMVMSDTPTKISVQVEDSTPRTVTIDRMVLRKGTGDSIIVMGGVPYPIPREHDSFDLGYQNSLVAWVGMAEVDFQPSREQLRFTTQTKQAVKAIHQHFDAQAAKALQKEINAATRASDALRVLLKWGGIVPERIIKEHSFTYQGKNLPAMFKLDGENERMVVLGQRPHKISAHNRQASVQASTALDAVWFYNYDRPTFSAGQRKKINHWATQQWPGFPYGEGVPEHFILVGKKPDMTFLDETKMIDWSIIQAIRLPRSTGNGGYSGPTGRIAGSYDMYQNGVYREGVPADEIDLANPVYYMLKRSERWSSFTHWDMEPYAKCLAHFEDATLVVLTTNRLEKFQRSFPNAQEARQGCENLSKQWAKDTPDAIKELIAFQDSVRGEGFERLREVGPSKDPLIEKTFRKLDRLKDNQPLTDAIQSRNMLNVSRPTVTTKWTNPITKDKYPLAFDRYGGLNFNQIEHLALYINAVATAAAKA